MRFLPLLSALSEMPDSGGDLMDWRIFFFVVLLIILRREKVLKISLFFYRVYFSYSNAQIRPP